MSTIPVPEVLNQIAAAGEKGLPIAGIRAASWSCAGPGECPSKPRMSRPVWFSTTMSWCRLWIESETPAISWDRLRVLGFFETGSTNEEACREGPAATLRRDCWSMPRSRHRDAAERVAIGVLPRVRDSISRFCSGRRIRFNCWPLLTHVASIALAQVLKELSAEQWIPHPLAVDLKWPNDVLLSGKKTAGILLETVQQEQHAAAAVLGVGINIKSESLPEELKEIATSVSQRREFSSRDDVFWSGIFIISRSAMNSSSAGNTRGFWISGRLTRVCGMVCLSGFMTVTSAAWSLPVVFRTWERSEGSHPGRNRGNCTRGRRQRAPLSLAVRLGVWQTKNKGRPHGRQAKESRIEA